MFNFSYYKPGRGEPDDGERETLAEQAQFLADNLRVTNQFFHELLVLDIISSKDINLVKGKSSREKMVTTFVELLQRKPTTHYHKFMEVLKRTNQIFVFEEMERRRHEKVELKRLSKHDGSSGGQTSRVEPVKYFDYDTLKADTGAGVGGRSDEELYTKSRIEDLERRRAELLNTNVTRPDYGYRTPRAADNRPGATANFTSRIRDLESRVARLEYTTPSDAAGQWNTPRY